MCLSALLQGAVATTADAKGMFPEHHEQYIGMPGHDTIYDKYNNNI
jgi:thiamine pyrophosphate-dependent acetolactate synthase large subunit-like protein